MKILKFKKISNDKYKLYLDNNETITLYEDVIINNNLLLTKQIDNKEIKNLLNQNNEVYAYGLALKFISIRMRSKKEVYDYLLKKNISQYLIDIIIDKLLKEGYLNDFKFSCSYINDQMLLSNYGPYKIKNNLIKYGVDSDIINEAIEGIKEDVVIEKLSKLLEKQVKIKKGSTNLLKVKLVNYFINLGFDKEMIIKELDSYELKSDPEKLKHEYNKLYNKYKNKYEGSKLTYFIAQKLYSKGYTSDDIASVIKDNN